MGENYPLHLRFTLLRGELTAAQVDSGILAEFNRLSQSSEDIWRCSERRKIEIQQLRGKLSKVEKEGKKQRREKNRKTETVAELKDEIKRNSEIYHNKLERLLKESTFHEPRKITNTVSTSTQCTTISTKKVSQMESEIQLLQRQLASIQKLYQNQHNQLSSSKLLIHELYKALQECQQARTDAQAEKEGDISTLDGQSIRNSDQYEDERMDTHREVVEVQGEIKQEKEGVLSSLWYKSQQFYEFIFRQK